MQNGIVQCQPHAYPRQFDRAPTTFEAKKPDGPLPPNNIGRIADAGWTPTLRMADGGQWRLMALGRQDHLLGYHVRVEGAREGHDIVAADRIIAK